MRRGKHIASVIGLICGLATFHSECQTNLPSPAVQTAVSNILRQLTNDEARAAFRARLAKQFQNQQSESLPTNVVVGWSTNGPAVFTHIRLASTNYNSNPVFAELNRLGYPTPPLAYLWYYTNVVFHHYLPESLNNLCWTNFMAHTNGRTPQIWSVRQHPSGWPAQPPIVRWNTNGLMWGMKGLTGICPCWETEEAPGWRPITALTRRHGYTRGHDIGPDGFGTGFAGRRVWFVTKNNEVVQTTVLREVVRTRQQSRSDYTIVLFSQDLPTTIEPLRVTSPEPVAVKLPIYFNTPMLIYMTEQLGNVGNGSPGFNVAIMKAGDSGSANMVPLLNELVFYAGRTTTGPTPEMQADMDELCRKGGLNPAKYQLQWVDLSAFPSY